MTVREGKRHKKLMEAKRRSLLGNKMHHKIVSKNQALSREAVEEYPDLFKIDEELL